MTYARILVHDLTNFKELLKDTRECVFTAGTDILNDIEYVTKGNAPYKTGNLENSIKATSSSGANNFKGEVSISAYENSFDYGALRHDYPFNLGEGSLNKESITSNITGNTSSVGYDFGYRAAMDNGREYIEYLRDKLEDVFTDYSAT